MIENQMENALEMEWKLGFGVDSSGFSVPLLETALMGPIRLNPIRNAQLSTSIIAQYMPRVAERVRTAIAAMLLPGLRGQ